MSSRGIQTRDLAIHDDRRFWPRFSGILGALVKWLSSRTYAQVPLIEEVTFFMVWFDPDLPVLRIHLNNTGPTARLTARCYRARFNRPVLSTNVWSPYNQFSLIWSISISVKSSNDFPWHNSQEPLFSENTHLSKKVTSFKKLFDLRLIAGAKIRGGTSPDSGSKARDKY